MSGRRWLVPGVLALLCLPYFVGLGSPDLWDANESLYAEPPREALETGEWLAPTMNYDPWFVKPPGVTWITLPFYAAFGPNEFAGRLPMALFAAATILLTFLIGRRLAGVRAGLYSAAFLATTAKFFMYSRQLAGDVFLTTAFLAAGYLYLRWFQSEGRERRGIWLAAAVLGAAVLVKGPVSLLLPALFIPVHLLLAGRRDLFPRLRPIGPILVALALAVPWFLYMAHRYGDRFVDVYFVQHHLDRAFTSMFGGGRGVLYYPGAWMGDALPWSLAFPGALFLTAKKGRGGAWRTDPRLFPLLWSAVVFVFFTLSTGKRAVYLLPLYPTVALVLGITVDHLLHGNPGWRGGRFLVLPVLFAIALMLPAAIWLLAVFPEFRPMGYGALAILAVWTGALTIAWRRRALKFSLVSSFALLTLLAGWVAFRLGDVQPYRPARDFAERIAAEARPGDVTGRYDLGLQSLSFYGERPFFHVITPPDLLDICRRGPRVWVVMEEKHYPILEDAPDLRAEVVEEGEYLQVSLPALLGKKPTKRKVVLAKVEPLPAAPVR